MMTPKQLEDKFDEALDHYRQEIMFHVETFSQCHNNEYLTKDDMEQIARQTFYCLHDMKDILLEYVKENSR